MIVYKITNKVNGKVYIGQTITTLEKRWSCHSNIHSKCYRMKKAIQKYGVDNFNKEIIEHCESKEEMNSREEFWIKSYNSHIDGYNVKLGSNHTEETWRKISLKNTGRKNTPEACVRMSQAKQGHTPWNKGTKGKMVAWNKGTKKPYVLKGQKKVGVTQFSDDGIYIQDFRTTAAAAKWIALQNLTKSDINVIVPNIRRVCLNMRGVSYGYRWKFLTNKDIDFKPDYSPRPIPRLKSVYSIDELDNHIHYNSLKEATEITKATNICRAIKVGSKAGGFYWKFANNDRVEE